jgi:predicted regulator of amino acid metabolism with ACT domain
MSDQEIRIQAHTGSDGMVHLEMDIPTGIINQDIQLTVSYKTSAEEISQISHKDNLKEIVENVKPASRLAQYAGTITLTEDPLIFQERIRSE